MIRRVSLAAAITAILAVLAALPANAAPAYQQGTQEQSTVLNCVGNPEVGVFANALVKDDPQSLPKTGDVFYAATTLGRVGGTCGFDMEVHVEIVAPAGVAPAISESNPVLCNYVDITTDAETPASGCPQAAQSGGVYGAVFDQLTPGAPTSSPWPLARDQRLEIQIPFRSSRRLVGAAPSCARRNGDPPCLASQTGDSLQFADWVVDGVANPWLSPYVNVFVDDEPPPPTTCPPNCPRALTPHAAFSVTPKRPRPHHRAVFDANGSYETGGAIASYTWKFGDRRNGTGRRATHRFGKRKTYTVSLTVRDRAGRQATVTHRVKVGR